MSETDDLPADDYVAGTPGVRRLRVHHQIGLSDPSALPVAIDAAEGVPYVDVDSLDEFATLPTPDGWYWCEFFGGERQYRCFLVPDTFRRAEFLTSPRHERLLERSIRPVYSDGFTTVRQDPTHAMPAFYIVAPTVPYKATDDLSLNQYLAMRFVDHQVGSLMRTHLGISDILRVNEERQVAFQNVHTWLMPMDAAEEGQDLFDRSLLQYLLRYSSWRAHQDQIRANNETLRELAAASRLRRRAEAIMGALGATQLSPSSRLTPPQSLGEPYALSGVVYHHAGLNVAHDQAAGIPGALVITCDRPAMAGESDNLVTYLRMRFLDYSMRIALRQVLSVTYAYKLQEAKRATGYDLSPIRILPINDISKYSRIYNFAINEYLAEARNRNDGPDIVESTARLASWATAARLEAVDASLERRLRSCEL